MNNFDMQNKQEQDKDTELISVIVPVYNVSKYIAECVDSLLCQTYKNLEILLIDDGSEDGSGDICDRYVDLNDNVKVFHKTNGGLSDARNYGIQYAKGTYLSFLDSDDFVCPDYIEYLYTLLKQTNAKIAACSYVSFEDGSPAVSPETGGKHRVLTAHEVYELYYTVDHNIVTVAWGKIYARELFEVIQYPIGKLHEDEFISHRLFYRAERCVIGDEKKLYYRQRSQSIMKDDRLKPQKCSDHIEALEDRMAFFKSIGERQAINTTYLYYLKLVLYHFTRNEGVDKKAFLMRVKQVQFAYKKECGLKVRFLGFLLQRFPLLFILVYKIKRLL